MLSAMNLNNTAQPPVAANAMRMDGLLRKVNPKDMISTRKVVSLSGILNQASDLIICHPINVAKDTTINSAIILYSYSCVYAV